MAIGIMEGIIQTVIVRSRLLTKRLRLALEAGFGTGKVNVWDLPPVASCDDPVDRREEDLLSIVPRESCFPMLKLQNSFCTATRDHKRRTNSVNISGAANAAET